MNLESLFIRQDPGRYNADHDRVWETLCTRQEATLRGRACRQFYEGLKRIHLDFGRVPRLDDINTRISPVTGWTARAVPGYLDARYFFECLQRRIYPTTISLRSADSLDYIEEPDIFHDVFGHVGLMADPEYGAVMQQFGQIHDVSTSDQDLLEMTRLFWFTVEFGLIREESEIRILGSGLLSSPGEAVYCLGDKVARKPFRLADVVAQPFRIDVYQDVLFIAESLEQLLDAGKVLLYQFKERNAIRWPKRKGG